MDIAARIWVREMGEQIVVEIDRCNDADLEINRLYRFSKNK